MSKYEIKLFGAIEILRNGEALTEFRSQKALVLLAYLICARRPVTRDYLAGLGWPDAEQTQALGLLRRTLHNLTSRLPECLVADRRTVQFVADASVSIDTDRFVYLSGQEEPTAWSAAVELHRAPFLEGIYLDDAPELENWLFRTQEEYQAQYLRLLDRLLVYHTEAGELIQALAYAQRLVSLDPWREESQQQLMLLLARTGQLRAAMAQFHRFRRILRDELDTEPALSTRVLQDRIQRAAQQPTRDIPQPTTPLIGRGEDVAYLVRLLASPQYRLITLIGVGGIGKSRLSIAVANSVSTGNLCIFLDGVCYVALAGIDNEIQLSTAVAHGLGLSLQGRESPDTEVFNYLRDKELLLVLDNFEQLIDEQSLSFLVNTLEAAPEVKLLVTSRIRLGLQSEQLYWLQGLRVPSNDEPAVSLAVGREHSAIQLWQVAVRRYQPEYAVSASELPAVNSIARQVQGLPLALEFAAAWRSTLTSDEIADELTQSLNLLAVESADVPRRRRSMRAVIQTSWRLLTSHQQSAFVQLSVFRAGFTSTLAQAVAGTDAVMLRALQDQSLISPAADGRFTLHELVRQFAAEKLIAVGEHHATHRRLALALRAAIEQIEPASRLFGARPGLTRMEDEYGNVQAALQWCFSDGDGQLGLALVAAFREYWHATNTWREGCNWQELALGHPPASETQVARATVLNEYGILLRLMGEIERALAAHQEALTLFDVLGLENEASWACYYLARPEFRAGDSAKCIEQLSEVLASFRRQGDSVGTAYALQQLAIQMLEGPGDLVRAQQVATESLAIARRLDLRGAMAGTLVMLGEIAIRQDDLTSAEDALSESITLSSEGSGLRSWALGKLGRVYLKQGLLSEAKQTFQDALRIRQALGSVVGVAWMLEMLGEVAVVAEEFSAAAEMFSVAAALRGRQGQPLLSIDKESFEALVAKTRAALGEELFALTWDQGEQLARTETDFVARFGMLE